MKYEELLKRAQLWFWQGLNLVRTEWFYYLRLLKCVLALSFVGVSIGILVSNFGYRMLSSGIIDFGRIITGASSLIASVVVCFLIVRLGASLYGVSTANRLVTGLVREASRPLPSTPIGVPQVIDDETTKATLRGIGGVYAALAFMGAIATALPVYTSPGLFFASLLFLVFIVYGASTWAPTGEWLRRFQKMSLVFAVVSVIFLTVLCFVPGAVQRYHDRAMFDAAQRQIEAQNFPNVQAQIQKKQREKNEVLNSTSLTKEQKAEKLKKIDQEIEFTRNGGSEWSDWLPGWFDSRPVEISSSFPSASSQSKSEEINQNSGPYYKNPDSGLSPGKAYKFPHDPRVYIYQGGKLRPVANGTAYLSHYGCSGGQRVIDCAPVYEMPSNVKPGSDILKGETIR